MHRSSIILALTFAAIFTIGRYEIADEPFPQSLVGLLKPDMQVGILWISGTAAVELKVNSEEQYGIARDTHNLTLEQLKKKYVAVDKQVQETSQHYSVTQGDHAQGATLIVPRTVVPTCLPILPRQRR